MNNNLKSLCILLLLALSIQTNVFGQSTVTGTVVDERGESIPGANVVVKGTTTGTITDFDGKYSLEVPDGSDILVFTFVGYTAQEMKINGQSIIDIRLTPDLVTLNELVVVGYGSQERTKVTSALVKLDGSDIADLPVVSADQALQGRVSGVFVSGSGSPGRNPTIRIRGLGSAINSDPLFVVDGVPIGQNALNDFHPDNIENISVLKDAASTAIYGSRAANGVVLITTKIGQTGKPKLSITAYKGVRYVPKSTHYDLLNTDQYINYGQNTLGVNAARFNDYNPSTQSFITGTPSAEFNGVETDWQSELMPTGYIEDYYARYSGGTDKIIYNVGGGYFKQDGVLIGTFVERATLNARMKQNVTDKFRMGQSIVLTRRNGNQDFRSPITEALQMMPYIPVRDASRLGGFRGPDGADGADPFQPILHSLIVEDGYVDSKIFAQAFAEVEPIEGLKFRIQGGYENTASRSSTFNPTYDAGEVLFNVNTEPSFSFSSNLYESPIVTALVDYNKTFGDHSLGVVAGYERQTTSFEDRRGGTTLLANENILNPGDADVAVQNSSRFIERTGIISQFARVNYDYEGRYLFSASVRRDQSSRFGPDDNTGIFPAVSLGWRISEEPFFAGLKGVLSDLKIRGSWGFNGNTAVPAYSWDPVVRSRYTYNFGANQVQGVTTDDLFNRAIRWESIRKFNIGFDAELLEGRIVASFEWFDNQSNDLVVSVPISASTGLEFGPNANIGDLSNKGIELTLGYEDKEGDFKWNIDANVSTVTNNVETLGADENAALFGPVFQNTGLPTTRAIRGEPIGHYYGWKVDRIYQTEDEIIADDALAKQLSGDDEATRYESPVAPGDIRFQDLNGDGIVNAEDRTNIGHYLPKWTIGLNYSSSYKNFDASINIQSALGFEILHANRYVTEGATRLFNAGVEVLDAWTPENTNTDIPRANTEAGAHNARLSDRWVEKGDYARIRFLTIGYTLPESIIDLTGVVSKFRVYVQAQNLYTLTGYTGYDPEVQGRQTFSANGGTNPLFFNGVDASVAPNPRSFLLGLQITF